MKLTAIHSPFTTFCEGPDDIESSYRFFYLFHRRNFLHRLPKEKGIEILVISSGVGYFQYSLKKWGYTNVRGIDTDSEKAEYARKKGFLSECIDCFDYLEKNEDFYDLIFAEQEVNHLTRDEFLYFLSLCFNALKPNGQLIITAANCANPLIAPEYLGNNIDHYTSFTENNLMQFFSMTKFKEVEVFPHDFYVLWTNPLNYVAKIVTGGIHFLLKMLFKMYGKSNQIFTKRIGVIATK
jgi:2-polyprenyl-3-methyl-5-hydroxy-6-metoxy-1,4-benzoquinol methylase